MLFVVWYTYVWVDFDLHFVKELLGIFDKLEDAIAARNEKEYEIFAVDCDFDEQVYVERLKKNTVLCVESP